MATAVKKISTTNQKPISTAASRYSRLHRSMLAGIIAALLVWPSLASAQSYTVAPSPFLTILDNTGNVVNLGCIWTYEAGTTTPATTYSDSAGTTNTNPIIADSAGRFTAYLTPGQSYKFTYENVPCSSSSHGTTLRTADNIAAVPVSGLNVDVTVTAGAALSSGDVVYISDGSGSLNAGQAYQADADNTYSSTTAVTVGLATAAIASAGSGTARITGRVTGLTGLTAGDIYYVSATAAALTATPPTNARCVGKADTTTSLIIPCDTPDVRLPDSDGTHSLVIKTTSDLTADRLLTLVPGDAARTLTMSGNASLDQNVLTTSSPTFVGLTLSGAIATPTTVSSSDDYIFTANKLVRRNTSDASDNGTIEVNGGGATGSARGGGITVSGNEASAAGDIVHQVGNVAGAEFSVLRADGTEAVEVLGTTGNATLTSNSGANGLIINSTHASTGDFSLSESGTARFTASYDSSNNVFLTSTGGVLGLVGSTGIHSTTIDGMTTAGGSLVRIESNLLKKDSSSLALKRNLRYFDADRTTDWQRIFQLRGFLYQSASPSDNPANWYAGFGAEDVYPVLPELVTVEQGKPVSVMYERMAPYFLEMGKAHEERLNKQLDVMNLMLERMDRLERENAELRARLAIQ